MDTYNILQSMCLYNLGGFWIRIISFKVCVSTIGRILDTYNILQSMCLYNLGEFWIRIISFKVCVSRIWENHGYV